MKNTYASIVRNMKARLEKCARWCEFDDYTYSLNRWSNDDHTYASAKTYDSRYNVLWWALLVIYDDDTRRHKLSIVFDKSISLQRTDGGKPERFDSVDALLDAMEEKRQGFVKRYYRKTREKEAEDLLDILD